MLSVSEKEIRMKKSIRAIFSFTLLIFTMYCSIAIAEPTIPKEKIPHDIPKNVQQQIAQLYSSDPLKRAYAAVSLGQKGNAAIPSIPFLVAMLDDYASLIWSNPFSVPHSGFLTVGDERTTPGKEAALAIWRIKNIEAFEILFNELGNQNKYTRRNVAKALCETKDARVLKPLIVFIKDKRADIQDIAIPELGKFEDKIAIDFLIELMKNENNKIREYAGMGLRNSKSKRATDALLLALKDEYYSVRFGAAEEMGKRKEKRSLEPLINIVVKDDDWSVRNSAAKALGEIGDRRAVGALINALKDTSAGLRAIAAYSLGEIGDKRAVNALITSLDDKDFWVRASSAEALGSLRATDAIKPLIEALKNAQKDKVGNVCINAALALEKITGNKFGNNPDRHNPDKWEEWWNENKNSSITDKNANATDAKNRAAD